MEGNEESKTVLVASCDYSLSMQQVQFRSIPKKIFRQRGDITILQSSVHTSINLKPIVEINQDYSCEVVISCIKKS